MNDTYVYLLDNNLYINLTNRCCNDCSFCVRNLPQGIGDHHLWLRREPEAVEIIALINQFEPTYKDIVFCGYGESTYRVAQMCQIAAATRHLGKPIRLNTNGLGNLINGRNIVPELAGLIDIVSISLNQCTKEKYQAIVHSVYGLKAFDAIIEWGRLCLESNIRTIFTVVDCIPIEDIVECVKIVERLGGEIRVRNLIK